MINLYELTQDMKELEELITVENEENATEQFKKALEIVKDQVEKKSDNIISLMLNIESDINSIDSEVKRLQALKESKKNQYDRLKNWIKVCMQENEVKSIKTAKGNITIRAGVPSVIVDDINALDDKYKRSKTTVEADKTLIKEHFNETGEILEGVTIKVEPTILMPKLKKAK